MQAGGVQPAGAQLQPLQRRGGAVPVRRARAQAHRGAARRAARAARALRPADAAARPRAAGRPGSSLLTHSLAHALARSLAHSLAHSLARSLTHSLADSLTDTALYSRCFMRCILTRGKIIVLDNKRIYDTSIARCFERRNYNPEHIMNFLKCKMRSFE